MRIGLRLLALALLVLAPEAGWPQAQPYQGPLIDAHSHLPSLAALDPLLAAMARHGVERVALLGVGGIQTHDIEWIEAAAKRHPDRIIPFAPLPDPTDPRAVKRLEPLLATRRFRGVGEVHVHQASRKIRRAADHPVLKEIYDVIARHGVPIVIHDELTPETTAELERALAHNRKAVIVLAHAGGADPAALRPLLARHPNLLVDLSGMHFLRKPALAEEAGPLQPAWKALLSEQPDRFLVGIDVWAPRLFTPETLARLMTFYRRILGELPPEAAEKIAYQNAVKLFRLK